MGIFGSGWAVSQGGEVGNLLDVAIVPVALIIATGYWWRRTSPGGVSGLQARGVLGSVVLYLFYPALVLGVVSSVELSLEMLWVPLLTALGIFTGTLLAWLAFRPRWFAGLGGPQVGSLLLACGFANTISVGIPVLQAAFGEPAIRFAIYADVLAVAPLLWLLGVAICLRYGQRSAASPHAFWKTLFRLPPVWALVVALCLNLAGVQISGGTRRALDMLGYATMPCMLLTVGMSLTIGSFTRGWGVIISCGVIRLALVPLVVLGCGILLVGDNVMVRATALEAAMPTMMATIVLSERFGLDTDLLATVMVGNTLLFFITGPVWLWLWA